MKQNKSENPTMKWHRGLKYSNTVEHPPMSIGRRYFREQLKRLIKQNKKESKCTDTQDMK